MFVYACTKHRNLCEFRLNILFLFGIFKHTASVLSSAIDAERKTG